MYNFNALGKINKLCKQQSQILASAGHPTRNAIIFARNDLFPLFLCLKISNTWNYWHDSGLSFVTINYFNIGKQSWGNEVNISFKTFQSLISLFVLVD